MVDLGQHLLDAALQGDQETLSACLAMGANANARDSTLAAPLHRAAFGGHASCVAALLEAGADPHARKTNKATPLHSAAFGGSTACVAALLAAGASPTAVNDGGSTPALDAAFFNRVPVLQALLAADPSVALLRNGTGRAPLTVALQFCRVDAARCLLAGAGLPPMEEMLAAVENALPTFSRGGEVQQAPLYTLLVERAPLTPEQWGRIPTPCAGLGAALPAVLERSTEEACLLVHRLPPADRARLHTFAVSLARVQRGLPASLPTPSSGTCWRCWWLAQCAAQLPLPAKLCTTSPVATIVNSYPVQPACTAFTAPRCL